MEDWKTFAAVWGAFLSTLLALLKLAHPRPIVTIAMVRPRDSLNKSSIAPRFC